MFRESLLRTNHLEAFANSLLTFFCKGHSNFCSLKDINVMNKHYEFGNGRNITNIIDN